MLRPLPGRPALVISRTKRGEEPIVVVADLHLGLGARESTPGGPPEGSAESLATELVAAAHDAPATRFVIAGDVKHPIVGVPRALRPVLFDFFSHLLESGMDVELVLGNHDVGIVPHLPREVVVHGAGGVVRNGVGIFHGHRWPSDDVLAAPALVAGHLHPGYRFAPTPRDPTGKRRCWVRVEPVARRPEPSGRWRHAPLQAREVVILPAFNPLAGTEALNREAPRRSRSFLYQRFLTTGPARVFLLDGTDVGRLPMPLAQLRPTPRAKVTGSDR
ncbi:MAG: metallophosphoesterase [Thermoplasmata archaeon]